MKKYRLTTYTKKKRNHEKIICHDHSVFNSNVWYNR